MKTVQEVDQLGEAKWQHGFCHIFADVLQDYLGRGEIAAAIDNTIPQHVYLYLDGLAYDSMHKGILEEDMLKGFDNPKSYFRVQRIIACDFKALCKENGIRLGEQGDVHLYDGAARIRLMEEARIHIQNDEFYREKQRSFLAK